MSLTDAQRIDALETAVTRLEAIIGVQFMYDRETSSLAEELKAENELPTGQYPMVLNDYQIRAGIAELAAHIERELAAIRARQPADAVGESSGLPLRAPAGAVAVKEMRNASSELLTSEVLHAKEIGANPVHEPQAFLGEVGIGGYPIAGVPLAMRKNGGVAFIGERSTGTQEGVPMVRAAMVWHEHHDNGFRIMQGGVYIGGKLYRTGDDIRMMALDGAGKFSMSLENYASGRVERGQLWAVWEDLDNPEGPMLWFQSCMAGMGIGVVGSTQTMNEHNPNANDRGVVLVAPIKASREATRDDLVNV